MASSSSPHPRSPSSSISSPCPQRLEKFLNRSSPVIGIQLQPSSHAQDHESAPRREFPGGGSSLRNPVSIAVTSDLLGTQTSSSSLGKSMGRPSSSGETGPMIRLPAFDRHIVLPPSPIASLCDLRQSDLPPSSPPVIANPHSPKVSSQDSFTSETKVSEIWREAMRTELGCDVERVFDSKLQLKESSGSLRFKKDSYRCCGVAPGDLVVDPNATSPPAEKYVLSPKQRRELAEREVEQALAEQTLRRAAGRKKRLETILLHQYPNGVLGSETPTSSSTEVYTMKKEQFKEFDFRTTLSEEERRKWIDEHRNSKFGHDPIAHRNLGDPETDYDVVYDGGSKLFQRKRCDSNRIGHHHTNANHTWSLMQANEPLIPPQNPHRLLRLVDCERRGRNYDIISGMKNEFVEDRLRLAERGEPLSGVHNG